MVGAGAIYLQWLEIWKLANEKIIGKYSNDDQVERLRVHNLLKFLRVQGHVGSYESCLGHSRECTQEAVGHSCRLRQTLHLAWMGNGAGL